ncbi:MAG: Ca-activated chloride channel family protein, partial [Shewanella sp.]
MVRQIISVKSRSRLQHWKSALLLVATFYAAVISTAMAAESMDVEQADSTYRITDEIQQGSLITLDASGNKSVSLPMKTQVSMQVSGWTNRVSVRHEFHNDQPFWVNGEYVFPLPNEAAVDGLRMLIGDRVIEGEIKEKQKAKTLFNAAKKAGKSASLLQQNRANIFSAQVANLAPGETLIVELNYQEVVNYDQGMFSLRFPMVVAPRYQPKGPPTASTLTLKSASTSITEYAASAMAVWNR